VILPLLLAGCYEQSENTYQFKWAAVNGNLLEKEIYKLVEKQNPIPDEMLINGSELSSEHGRLRNEIHYLKTDLIKKCMFSRKQLEQEKKKTTSPKGPLQRGGLSGDQAASGRRSRYDKDCVVRAESDPRIAELNKKKEKYDAVVRMRSKHKSQLKEFSRDYARKLIEQYAKSKFEIVVNEAKYNVLYNAEGLKLDITKALISEVDESKLVLPDES
jgi:hypothetical protein